MPIMSKKVPLALSKAEVLDEAGKPVAVSSLWATKPVVIMWVRHFGCIACAAQVDEFRPEIKALRAANVDFAIIGSGAAHFVEGFKERMGLDVPVYSDEKRVTYEALEMRRGLATMFDRRMLLLKNFLWPFKYRQRKVMGDPLQQGGVLVVRPGGTITYEYISEYNGDHPAPTSIVEAAVRS